MSQSGKPVVIYLIFVKSISSAYPIAPAQSCFYHIPIYARSYDFFYSCFLFPVPNPCLQFFHFRSPFSDHSICSCSCSCSLFPLISDSLHFYLNPILILARSDLVYKLSMSIIVWQFVNYIIPLSVPSPISTSSSTLLFFSKSLLKQTSDTPSKLHPVSNKF